MTRSLRVGIVGCGLIGWKRAEALRPQDEVVGCYDVVHEAAAALAEVHGGRACTDLTELLALRPDVVVVATPHDRLAELAEAALESDAHVLVEKPAAIGTREVDALLAAQKRAARLVKVGFNHRFYPGLARLHAELRSGRYGELLHLRARYGHGGRVGYEREWRADPLKSGGGELVDQGMHLLDLTHWIAGPLPFHSALLRTSYWDMPVEDNAAILLGDGDARTGVWAMLHVSWTEWKNLFSLEVYCRDAKLQVDGLVRSYGPQRLTTYRMKPELGPPDVEIEEFSDEDTSWYSEWENFAHAIAGSGELSGSLHDARYAWSRIEDAYAQTEYADLRRSRG